MLQKFHGVILALIKFPKITIAEVHGACLGGGAELAMVCDMCFTTPDAKWGFPEISLGCYPPVACTALAALVGQKRAADWSLPDGLSAAKKPPSGDWRMKRIRKANCSRRFSARSIIC